MSASPSAAALSARGLKNIAFAAVIFSLPLGCSSTDLCPLASTATAKATTEIADVSDSIFSDRTDPYASGPLDVHTFDIDGCASTANLAMRIHTPTQRGAYPVVILQHGFVGLNTQYDEILRHLASHGFIVVAPQMYDPSVGAWLGDPTADWEADHVVLMIDAIKQHLSDWTGVNARMDRLGLAGHSRGGKIVWMVVSRHPEIALSIAGIDPVDGASLQLGGTNRVIQDDLAINLPTLVLGAGLEGPCAPEGDNHAQFFKSCRTLAWHVVATDYGHIDMLDRDEIGASGLLCGENPGDTEPMRVLTGGLLTAFFRGTLQGDETAFQWLTAAEDAPARCTIEEK